MLKHRSNEAEIMDNLNISGQVVEQTLKELNIINRFLGGNSISIRAFARMAGRHSSVSLADLGCGGGDIMTEMAGWCRRKGIQGRFIGIDANANIVEYAQKNAAHYPEITFRQVNIFSDEFRSQQADIIHCCLFTHHFTDEELIRLFRQMKKQARIGVIINDLHRHPVAYWSITLLTRFFSRSAMVRNDAAVSVARGFKKAELKDLLRKADITDYRLSWKWAFRWKLIF